MKTRLLLFMLALATSLAGTTARAAVSPDEASFDAARMEPYRQTNEKYKTVEKQGNPPGPWSPSAWADGAIVEMTLVPDAGDGKPALKLVNVSGRSSGMFKPWTPMSLGRGSWVVAAEYRKVGSKSGMLVLAGPSEKKQSVSLTPTGGSLETVTLSVEVTEESEQWSPTFQLYSGTGEGEALYIRSFKVERVGAVSDETKAAEVEAKADLLAAARKVAEREAARRAAERKPINGWVRPEAKPVKMDKPLDPPPVTGTTYYVAKNGDDKTGDGSEQKPWGSIQHGMNQLHPGDRLYIRGGEYRENMLTFARSGKADAYITVAGYPGEKALIIGKGGMAIFNLSAGSRWTPLRLHEEAYLVIRDLHLDADGCNNAVRIHGPMMLPEYKGDVVKSRGLRHNIWVVGCDITGDTRESTLGAAYGAHDVIISNNTIHDGAGVNSYTYSDGTIVEWNTVYNTGRDSDDAGAIKSMAPGVILRYNTVHDSYRSSTTTSPGWAPSSQGGKQWRHLQGVTGIYVDWGMVSKNNDYPQPLIPADPANYVYGNTVYNCNAGIYIYKSDHAQVFDNVVYSNGRTTTGGWVEGKEGGKWLTFGGPAGYGIRVSSNDVKVYDNLSYDNQKAGLAISTSDLVAFNNVFFGNDLAQIHVQKGDGHVLVNNTIIQTADQGPPFRRGESEFATVEAFREKHAYMEDSTRVVEPEGTPSASAVETARRLREEGRVSDATLEAARERIAARQREAGIGQPVEIIAQASYDPTGGLQQPLPWALPGIVEFENYDVGGPGVSFQDTTSSNRGGHYRHDDVDIKASPDAGNGAVVGFTEDGEWMEYTVSVEKAGDYPVKVTYATPMEGKAIRLTLDGKPLGEPIALKPTASWEKLETIDAGKVALPMGDGVLRVTIESGPIDLDRMQIGNAN